MAKRTECLLPVYNDTEPYFLFEGEKRKKFRAYDGCLPRISKVRRYSDNLKQKTHELAGSEAELNRIYPDAIEIARTEMKSKLNVCIAMFGFLIVDAGTLFSAVLFASLGGGLLFALWFFAIFVISSLLFWWSYRIGFQGPTDEPIIFNRKTRTVTAYHVSVPNVFKVKSRPEVRITTCSWDLVNPSSAVRPSK